ncbi:MAG: divergent polysaccharide deacetylase family protein [Sulfurimonas sp.]|nr:MAG: divergent polysaccharide deacetylase family protein [Sulfurimonas sp.]
MAKRKYKKRTPLKRSSFLFILSWVAVALIAVILLVGMGYYYGYEEGRTLQQQKTRHEIQSLQERIKILQANAKKHQSEWVLQQKLRTVLKENGSIYKPKTAAHEYADGKKHVVEPPKAPKRDVVHSSARPKLAIIIDDVSFSRDVRAIKALKIPITMSFLPPSERHPNSAKLARKEPFYMVHLPLEAMHFNSEERYTLRVSDTQKEIASRIENIKKLFPRVAYMNNHTGSKFTADEGAVNRLIFTLRKNNIRFIDSRTTAETKIPKVMQSYGSPYIARDVFLDHESNVSYIKKQIALAVKKAKQHGSAIAIGHPRRETLQALRESKELLDQVQLVRIDTLI